MARMAILQFAAATLLPVVASIILRTIEKKTGVQESHYVLWQIAVGLVFGGIAIFGTEFGIDALGATMNVRDAAPLTAGLIFGGPAGIIAGLIGGIERWFSVYWGRGMFTRVACSIATAAAGFYAATLRRVMFSNKKPVWVFALVIGVVTEVLHLLLVFATNLNDVRTAFVVVRACNFPMIFCNAVAVALAVITVTLMDGEDLFPEPERRSVSQTVQSWMLAAIVTAFVLTMSLLNVLQERLSHATTSSLLTTNISDVEADISYATDSSLLRVTHSAAAFVPRVKTATSEALVDLKAQLRVSEISVINDFGIICASTEPDYIGFDMHNGDQAREFLHLLPSGDAKEFVQSFRPTTRDSSVYRKYAGVSIEGGFIQVGIDADRLQEDTDQSVLSASMNRHIGESGFLVILDYDGDLVSVRDEDQIVVDDRAELLAKVESPDTADDEVFEVSLFGLPCYAMYRWTEGYRIVGILPADEADFSRDVASLVSSYMTVLIFALLFGVVFYLIRRTVIDKVHVVNDRLSDITDGKLDTVVSVRSNEEFTLLSAGINSTVDTLKRYIAEAEARIDQELEYARSIQHSALPSVFPPFPTHREFEIYATMDAAKEVGGDFYDFYLLDEDHLAFLVADVSGKGIPAALFMMRAKTILKSYAESGIMVQDVVTCGNAQLCEGNDANMFVTAWMGVIDLRTGHVEYANAGHNPPAVRRAGGSFELLKSKRSIVMGCMEDVSYALQSIDLAPGDVIYLYTDGVVEANNEVEELYGEDRMLAALDAMGDVSMDDLCHGMRADVDRFAGAAPQFDDMTMLALRFNGRIG